MTRPRRDLASAAVLLAIAGFLVLGVWQLERRAWKLDLIARVDARLAADPVAAPGPAAWPTLAPADAYTRVHVTGRFLENAETPDFTVLVNRGFVPTDRRDPATHRDGRPMGETSVTGLLRLSEPTGGFLRANDPVAGRWYSRDVAAIAEASALAGPVAPYFIDADAGPNPGGLPIGGLTVLRFRNAHLSYALTWFALAAGLALLAIRAARHPPRA